MLRRSALISAALVAMVASAIVGGASLMGTEWGLAALAASAAGCVSLAVHLISRRIENAAERIEARLTVDQLQRGVCDWRLQTRFSATPDLIWIVAEELLRGRARLCVELGAGVSTLVLGRIIREQGLDCRLVSVEHDASYAERIRSAVKDEGLVEIVTVVDAPLEPVAVEGYRGLWYRTAGWGDSGEPIDVLLVDGPPKRYHRSIRSAAVPVLRGRLASGALVVLDDARRAPERRAFEAWKKLLPGCSAEYRDTGHGIGVIRSAET